MIARERLKSYKSFRMLQKRIISGGEDFGLNLEGSSCIRKI